MLLLCEVRSTVAGCDAIHCENYVYKSNCKIVWESDTQKELYASSAMLLLNY